MLRCLKRVLVEHLRVVVVLLAVLVVVGTASGLYLHALQEWQAAQKAVEQEQGAEARRHLKACLGVWPRSVSVHLLAARAARLSGDFADAESHLKQCLKLARESTADVELEFLLLRVQTGEADVVAPTLWQCVEEHHPQTPLILETLAQAYIHTLRFGPALSCLERCLQEAPERARARYWRGWIFERLADRKEAKKDYQKAVELDPDLVPARLHLAELCLQLSLAEEALPHLEYLQRHHPERADVKARLAHCRYLQGDAKEARRLLESTVKELPDDLSLLILLGRLDNDEENYAQAERWLRHALEVDPTDPEAQHLLARSLQGQNRSQEAQAVEKQRQKDIARLRRINDLLREAAQHPLSSSDSLFELGRLFLDVRQEQLGLYWLHQALENDPSYPGAHQVLADYFEKKGDREQAEAHRRWLRKGEKRKDMPARNTQTR